MASNSKSRIGSDLPGSRGDSFSDRDDYILRFKPNLSYIEPEQLADEDGLLSANARTETDEISQARQRTEALIKNYDAVNKLADLAQQRIDDKVKTSGGLDIVLDPVRDAHVISALKRTFPKATDYSRITYDQYKHCLKEQSKQQVTPAITPKDIQDAKSDPNRVDFGGLKNPAGSNRAELSSLANSPKPIDLTAFQAAGILILFKLLRPYIQAEDEQRVARHLVEVPHRPI